MVRNAKIIVFSALFRKMSNFNWASALVSMALLGLVNGYPYFRDEIPNGYNVPNPCDASEVWEGVGHEDHQGGGPRNVFGKDFFNAGKKWTVDLCRKDSDGDGKTNGEELGDPLCVWVKGAQPSTTDRSKLSHPGVCDPITSPDCIAKNTFLTQCEALGLTTPAPSSWCPAIGGSDVQNLTLRYDKAKVPADETVYLCQQFDLPDDVNYQMIAWQPIIDNRKILHHMVVFACEGGMAQEVADKPFLNPTPCRMIPPCGAMIVVWAYGIDGQCYNEKYGAPFGKTHYKTVILQMHYNNDYQTPGYVDSSGVTIYYTNKLRSNNKGLIAFGEMYLTVPPRTEFYETPAAVLSSECSQRFLVPFKRYYLTSMLIHIHRQGTYAKIMLNKKKAGYSIMILNQTMTYDRPVVATWNDPYEILYEPGDEFVMTCGYNTMNKRDWTFFGSQTNDEMCYAFIDVYPRPFGSSFFMPANLRELDSCAQYPKDQWIVDGCNFTKYHAKLGLEFGIMPDNSSATTELLNACACWGPENYPAHTCSSDCFSVMKKYNLFGEPCVATDPIFQEGMRPWYDNSEILHRAQSQMSVCQTLKSAPPSGTSCLLNKTGAAPSIKGSSIVLLSALMAVVASILAL